MAEPKNYYEAIEYEDLFGDRIGSLPLPAAQDDGQPLPHPDNYDLDPEEFDLANELEDQLNDGDAFEQAGSSDHGQDQSAYPELEDDSNFGQNQSVYPELAGNSTSNGNGALGQPGLLLPQPGLLLPRPPQQPQLQQEEQLQEQLQQPQQEYSDDTLESTDPQPAVEDLSTLPIDPALLAADATGQQVSEIVLPPSLATPASLGNQQATHQDAALQILPNQAQVQGAAGQYVQAQPSLVQAYQGENPQASFPQPPNPQASLPPQNYLPSQNYLHSQSSQLRHAQPYPTQSSQFTHPEQLPIQPPAHLSAEMARAYHGHVQTHQDFQAQPFIHPHARQRMQGMQNRQPVPVSISGAQGSAVAPAYKGIYYPTSRAALAFNIDFAGLPQDDDDFPPPVPEKGEKEFPGMYQEPAKGLGPEFDERLRTKWWVELVAAGGKLDMEKPKVFQNFIKNHSQYCILRKRYMKIRNRFTRQGAQDDDTYPQSDVEEQQLAKIIFDAMVGEDSEDGEDGEEQEHEEGEDHEKQKKDMRSKVNYQRSWLSGKNSPLELEILAFHILYTIWDMQDGIINVPLNTPLFHWEHYGSFQERFNATLANIKKSKSLVHNMAHADFTKRHAAAPKVEIHAKDSNRKLNLKRANNLKDLQSKVNGEASAASESPAPRGRPRGRGGKKGGTATKKAAPASQTTAAAERPTADSAAQGTAEPSQAAGGGGAYDTDLSVGRPAAAAAATGYGDPFGPAGQPDHGHFGAHSAYQPPQPLAHDSPMLPPGFVPAYPGAAAQNYQQATPTSQPMPINQPAMDPATAYNMQAGAPVDIGQGHKPRGLIDGALKSTSTTPSPNRAGPDPTLMTDPQVSGVSGALGVSVSQQLQQQQQHAALAAPARPAAQLMQQPRPQAIQQQQQRQPQQQQVIQGMPFPAAPSAGAPNPTLAHPVAQTTPQSRPQALQQQQQQQRRQQQQLQQQQRHSNQVAQGTPHSNVAAQPQRIHGMSMPPPTAATTPAHAQATPRQLPQQGTQQMRQTQPQQPRQPPRQPPQQPRQPPRQPPQQPRQPLQQQAIGGMVFPSAPTVSTPARSQNSPQVPAQGAQQQQQQPQQRQSHFQMQMTPEQLQMYSLTPEQSRMAQELQRKKLQEQGRWPPQIPPPNPALTAARAQIAEQTIGRSLKRRADDNDGSESSSAAKRHQAARHGANTVITAPAPAPAGSALPSPVPGTVLASDCLHSFSAAQHLQAEQGSIDPRLLTLGGGGVVDNSYRDAAPSYIPLLPEQTSRLVNDPTLPRFPRASSDDNTVMGSTSTQEEHTTQVAQADGATGTLGQDQSQNPETNPVWNYPETFEDLMESSDDE